MNELNSFIQKAEIISELSDSKDIKILTQLFIEYLQTQQDKEKSKVGFGKEKE